MPGSLIDPLDDSLVAVDKAPHHGHVAHVGPVKHIDDVTHKEGYQPQQDVAQGIVDDGQRQWNALDHSRREVDKWSCTQQRESVTPAGDKADDGVKIVTVGIALQTLHEPIDLAVFDLLQLMFIEFVHQS